ncbi:MAG: DUF3592 domain-containing protein [Bacteroidetes bacterium]|nr:DUF3592 domain-containing protein [Bacteroidota bacterium]
MAKKFLREAPPRYIDVYSQAVVIFSGFLQQFGWAFFTFGMIFVWVFGFNSFVRLIGKPMGEEATVKGEVQEVDYTAASENGQNIYRYTYTYIHDFREYEGVSYGKNPSVKEGDEIQVIYSIKHPERSYMEGTRRAMFNGWVLFVFLFPLIGLIFIVLAIRKNVHFLRMLRYGRATSGKLVKKEGTNASVTINDTKYPVFAYTFEFQHAGKTYSAKAKTHVTERLEDEEREIILYDELNPEANMLFDAVSGAPRIDAQGYFRPAPAWKLVLFILPLLAVLLNWVGYVLSTAL